MLIDRNSFGEFVFCGDTAQFQFLFEILGQLLSRVVISAVELVRRFVNADSRNFSRDYLTEPGLIRNIFSEMLVIEPAQQPASSCYFFLFFLFFFRCSRLQEFAQRLILRPVMIVIRRDMRRCESPSAPFS